ncbi:MAG: hypothetical protein AMXMBFR82_35730 [Candidatus Hydrogenedentota bacterium]
MQAGTPALLLTDAGLIVGSPLSVHAPRNYPEEVAASIPNIPFIPRDPEFAKEPAQFVPERELPVMRFLLQDRPKQTHKSYGYRVILSD